MAVYEIELDNQDAIFSTDVALDNITYKLKFKWNVRGLFWEFSIYLTDNTVLVENIRIVVNYPILLRYRKDKRLPQGILQFLDTSTGNLEPNRFDLGNRVILVYDDLKG